MAITALLGASLALSGVSTVSSIVSANQQAAAQARLARLRAAQDRLNLANAERDTRERLEKTLAAQNNFFAAAGVSPGAGASLRLANNAVMFAGRELGDIHSQRDLARGAGALRHAGIRRARRERIGNALIRFGQDAVDTGLAFAQASKGKS